MGASSLLVGLDVGSTTVKAVVLEAETQRMLYASYVRHNAEQTATLIDIIGAIRLRFPCARMQAAFCGSGGLAPARALGLPYVQEVAANAVAVQRLYPQTAVAIELGGQDAKVIFFRREADGSIAPSEMRMNGVCAGGTGAFLDQMAEILSIPIEDFNAHAGRGRRVYDISGRCGVFAKTDLQPLLNHGASRDDLALSCLHALAKQTIGGLAQGLDILPPVIFEGGPCTFNPHLVEVFRERLGFGKHDIIVPEQPEILVARGAALAIPLMFDPAAAAFDPESAVAGLQTEASRRTTDGAGRPFFDSAAEREEFERSHALPRFVPRSCEPGSRLSVWLGIDAGSTTTKFVLLDDEGAVANRYYANNAGNPLGVLKAALIEMRDLYHEAGIDLVIRGAGTTGYGERLFAAALRADYHTVETVAHAEAARHYLPEADFILDIGGQDMKAMFMHEGVIGRIVLNEACSAGCGSFLETYARSLGVSCDQIAGLAFSAERPSILGSRCTVFMNSSIITEQKNGRTAEDILAGLCRSIIENVFTKVVRGINPGALGRAVVVQGGTFKNDAVLRAFEQYTGLNAYRPPFPGEMGAIGAALLTKRMAENAAHGHNGFQSTFIRLTELDGFAWTTSPGMKCPFCANACERTFISFTGGGRFVSGNRCERGEALDAAEARTERGRPVPDVFKLHSRIAERRSAFRRLCEPKPLRIGIPRVFEFWESLPYWRTLFGALGFEVVVSGRSTQSLFEAGLKNVASDTVCFPAKLAHGHVQDLLRRGVDRIFMPMMIRLPPRNQGATGSEMCPIVQGYPLVIANSDDPRGRHGVVLDTPAFHWFDERLRRRQTAACLRSLFSIPRGLARAAIREGERAMAEFEAELRGQTTRVLASLEGRSAEDETDSFAVLLAARPYHADELVSHGLSELFTSLGVPVLSIHHLPGLEKMDLASTRMEPYNPYHTRLLEAAFFAARHPNLELVQIVSFGCGHDAILSDEIARIMREVSDREPLVLKLDESEARGPLAIRVRSFVETVRIRRGKRRSEGRPFWFAHPSEPYAVKFLRKDRKSRVVLAPNLSPAFTYVSGRILERIGMRLIALPLADRRAIELGKRYVHNDICFPAQVNIGEILAALESGAYEPGRTSVALAKNCVACRAGHYPALCRKALDEAGYSEVPIITTAGEDRALHPGFSIGPDFKLRLLWALAALDGLESMRRRLRPYERARGETDSLFNHHLLRLGEGVLRGPRHVQRALREAVGEFNAQPLRQEARRERVGIVGEILVNYHPSSNCHIERYLEENGLETVLPDMSGFFRKKNIADIEMSARRLHAHPFLLGLGARVSEYMFSKAHSAIGRILEGFRFPAARHSIGDAAAAMRGIIDLSYHIGEGWLMPGEIALMAADGVQSFVVLNPFGCMPNHITGRGMIKRLKTMFPDIRILPLDFDPDTSLANIENRLQMLIIGAKENIRRRAAGQSAGSLIPEGATRPVS